MDPTIFIRMMATRHPHSRPGGSREPPSLNTLIPELVAEIPAHLPLALCPATTISLALTCRRLCSIIIPSILYCAVRVEGEGQVLRLLSSLTANQLNARQDSQINRYIKHLAIVSGLSKSVRDGPVNALSQFQALLNAGGLSNLVTLTLHLEDGWFYSSKEGEQVEGFGELSRSFWNNLRQKCQGLTSVHLTGIVDEGWIANSGFIEFKGLETFRVEGGCVENDEEAGHPLVVQPSCFFPVSLNIDSIRVLELRISSRGDNDLSVAGRLFTLHFPKLHTIILDHCTVTNVFVVNEFWKNHQNLERIELGLDNDGEWFPRPSIYHFPNLKVLKCTFPSAKMLLPYVSSQLINLSLLDTHNAQALYLLRAVCPAGSLPILRSLGIHLVTSCYSKDGILEGERWYEDEEGHITEVSKRKTSRSFNNNYLSTLAKAVPALEELELAGKSYGTIGALTLGLRRFQCIRSLVISGPLIWTFPPFFNSSVVWTQWSDQGYNLEGSFSELSELYSPRSFEEAMDALGNGCRTLERIRVTSILGDLYNVNDIAVAVVRNEKGGPVKHLNFRKGWGRVIGREGEW